MMNKTRRTRFHNFRILNYVQIFTIVIHFVQSMHYDKTLICISTCYYSYDQANMHKTVDKL